MTDDSDMICECRFAPVESPEEALAVAGKKESNTLNLRFADGSAVPPPLHTTVVPLWNRRALTVVFSGAYNGTPPSRPDRIGRTERLWELDEVYECFIGRDARQRRTYMEFEVAPDGRWIDLQISLRDGFQGTAPSSPSGVRCLSMVTVGLWTAAVEIPWQALGCAAELRESLDCNFYRSIPAAQGGHLMAWAPVGDGEQCFHRPERFGRMILCK